MRRGIISIGAKIWRSIHQLTERGKGEASSERISQRSEETVYELRERPVRCYGVVMRGDASTLAFACEYEEKLLHRLAPPPIISC